MENDDEKNTGRETGTVGNLGGVPPIDAGTVGNLGGVPPIDAEKTLPVSQHYDLVNQITIRTTFDKLEILLLKYQKRLGSKYDWVGFLGAIATIAAVLATTTFNDRLWISACTWESIFKVGFIFTLCWLVKAIIDVYRSISVEKFMDELKRLSNTDSKL